MGRPRPIDRATYEKMTEALRASGGNISAAMKATGFGRSILKTAWFEGWPLRSFRPVKDEVDMDHLRTRAAMHEVDNERTRRKAAKAAEDKIAAQRQVDLGILSGAELAARQIEADAMAKADDMIARADVVAKAKLQEILDSAKMDAAMSAAAELQLVRSARDAAQSLHELMDMITAKANHALIAEAVLSCLAPGVEPKDIVATWKAMGAVRRDAVQMSQQALEMERQRLGKPVHILGVQQVDGTVADAEEATAEATSLLAAVKRERGAKVGGTGDGDTGPGGGSVH